MTFIHELFESDGAAPTKHRILVTVSDPDSPSVSQRKETMQRYVQVLASSDEEAIKKAKVFFKKRGYKVHDAICANISESAGSKVRVDRDFSNWDAWHDAGVAQVWPEAQIRCSHDICTATVGNVKVGEWYFGTNTGWVRLSDLDEAVDPSDDPDFYDPESYAEKQSKMGQARPGERGRMFPSRSTIDKVNSPEYKKKMDAALAMLDKTYGKKKTNESIVAEKSVSTKQARTMAAAAHDKDFANKVGIKQSVAKEFNKADKGTKMLKKAMKESKKTVKKVIKESAYKVADPTLQHILNRFKFETKEAVEFGEMSDALYDALYDYYADSGEMPYGVMKARDGDPYNWILERLDQDLHLSWGANTHGQPTPYKAKEDPAVEGLGEGEYDYEESELCYGCYVIDTQDPTGEVFKMTGDPDDRRVWIGDAQGRGWNISPHRLELVPEGDPRIAQYFGSGDDEDLDETRYAPGEYGGEHDPDADDPMYTRSKPRHPDWPYGDPGDESDDDEFLTDDSAMPEVEPGEEVLVEGLEGVVTDVLENVGLDNGLDFFFENGLVVIGQDTARVALQAINNDSRITSHAYIVSVDGEEVRISFGQEDEPEEDYTDWSMRQGEMGNPLRRESKEAKKAPVSEDVSMTITANGEEDFLSVLQRLSGMPVVAVPTQAAAPSPCGCNSVETDVIATEEDGEYANSPDEEVHTSTTAMINQGNDLNRPKRSFSSRPYRGDNPMAEATKLMREYDEMLRRTTKKKVDEAKPAFSQSPANPKTKELAHSIAKDLRNHGYLIHYIDRGAKTGNYSIKVEFRDEDNFDHPTEFAKLTKLMAKIYPDAVVRKGNTGINGAYWYPHNLPYLRVIIKSLGE